VINLVRQHAPDAAIAFDGGPEDCADAVLRWLRQLMRLPGRAKAQPSRATSSASTSLHRHRVPGLAPPEGEVGPCHLRADLPAVPAVLERPERSEGPVPHLGPVDA
jgi:hypothetical protein